MRRRTLIFRAGMILATVCAVFSVYSVRKDVSASSARKKARYYYLEGLRHQVEGSKDAAYEYFGKALRTDPDYKEAASAYGSYRLILNLGKESMSQDSIVEESLKLMQGFTDAYPGDFFESTYYAYVAMNIGNPEEAVRVFERTSQMNPDRTALLIHLADAYMACNDVKNALNALDRYEQAEGASGQLTLKRVGYMLSERDTLGAAQAIDRLVEAFPEKGEYRIMKGNFYDMINKPDSAFLCYSIAENLPSGSGAAKMALADYYKEKGDSVAYDGKIYEALLSEDFGLDEKSEVMAQYLQMLINNRQDTQRGDYLFSVLREQYPYDATVLDLAARYSAAKGDFKEACEQISYAIDQDASNQNYWGQLMSYQISDDAADQALKTYKRAEENLSPVPDGVKLLMASAAQETGDYDRATGVYEELIKEMVPEISFVDSVDNDSWRRSLNYEGLVRVSGLFTMMGDTYYVAKNLDKAFKNYDRALFFFADNALAANNYAYFLAETGGDLGRARSLSKMAVEQSPDNVTYLDTYAWVLFKSGDYKEALDYMRAAIEKSEQSGKDESDELYEHFGDILFMNGEPEKALEYWEKALKLNPEKELLKRKVTHNTYFFK